MTSDQKGEYDAPLYDTDCRDQIVALLFMLLAFVGFTFGLLIGRGL